MGGGRDHAADVLGVVARVTSERGVRTLALSSPLSIVNDSLEPIELMIPDPPDCMDEFPPTAWQSDDGGLMPGHVASLPLQLLKQCHSVDMTCAHLQVRPGADYAWSAIVWMKNDIADPPAEEDGERRHVETSIALVRCAPLDKTQDAWYCCALKTAW